MTAQFTRTDTCDYTDSTEKRRKNLIDQIWANIPTEIEAYSDLLDHVLNMLTDEQLQELHTEYCQ